MTPEQQAMDFNPDLENVSRERKLAELLMAKGFQQPQGQMISGYYVPPSFTQQINPLANMLAGQAVGERADKKGLELATALRGRNAQDIQTYAQLQETDPAKAIQFGLSSQNPTLKALVIKDLEIQKYNEGEIGKRRSIATGAMETIGKGNPKYRAPLHFDLGNYISVRDTEDPTIETQRLPKGISPEAAARLNQSAQELSFNTGMPVGGVGGGTNQMQPQAPMRTINYGSPVLAPNQAMPQGGQPTMPQNIAQNPNQMPIFRSKAEQDIYVATQKEKGKLQAEAQNALPAALLTAQTGIDTIRELIGDTTVDAKGNIVYGKQAPKAGFGAAVGMPSFRSGLGIANLFPASKAADFKAAFEQVGGQAFLGAISTLKGSGAISEVEGAKATSALNRMKLSQSEVEFIKAANDFKDVLEKGYKAAQQRAGTAPINPNAPLNAGPTRRLVYNPQTGMLE